MCGCWGQRETRVRTDTKSIISVLFESEGVGVGVNVRHGYVPTRSP